MMSMMKKFFRSRFRNNPFLKSLVIRKQKDFVIGKKKDMAVGMLKRLVCIYADRQHISWFGKQVARYLDEHPGAVSVAGDHVELDIELTSSEPGDWGDEIFDTMYETENAMRPVAVFRRDLMTVPDDWDKPEEMQSKEHFVAIHWNLSKKVTEV